MKLRNKKTGEIGELYFQPDKEYHFTVATEDPADMMIFKTIAELNEEWEDYEAPKTHWYIYGAEPFEVDECDWDKEFIEELKSIGNYFDTREEAEKAVEKLKAWKRLKDKGFVITDWNFTPDMKHTKGNFVKIKAEIPYIQENMKDLDLLFGGEE